MERNRLTPEERHQRLIRSQHYFYTHPDKFIKRWPEEYVAMIGHRVIAHAVDLTDLTKNAYGKFHTRPIFFGRVRDLTQKTFLERRAYTVPTINLQQAT